MGNNLEQNLTKIFGAFSRSDEPAYEKLIITGLFLFSFGITVQNIKSFCTVGGEHCDIKSDPKIQVRPGVRPHPNDPNKGTNPPHKDSN